MLHQSFVDISAKFDCDDYFTFLFCEKFEKNNN